MEINTVYESQFLKGKDFYFFILDKTESVSGLHQHDYYEFTIVLTGSCSQEINGKRVSMERGYFVFIPVGSYHQTFYDYGVTRILNMGVSRQYFEKHYLDMLPSCFIASQSYAMSNSFLTYIESTLATLNINQEAFDEFNKLLTFYIVNHLQHYKDSSCGDNIPWWLSQLVREMHNKSLFAENALNNMVKISGKTQSYLTRATNRYFHKTPGKIINDIRINYCKNLLETSNFSVADIAFEAGFSSPGMFINNFKKATSFTPGHYRRRLAHSVR
ncbi:TPA: transcriptional regulator ChbR [Citrobacter rodentium]|nr:transcriptional regulator ChbR [Citrobacter rodentium]